MMRYGRFNTNVDALQQRIRCHDKFGAYDLNSWIFEHMVLSKGLSILDLGSGTGKQTLPLAQIVGDTGKILAVDISQEALDILLQNAKELGLDRRVSLLCCEFDDLGEYFDDLRFDRVLASYSLYYAKHPRTVFEIVHYALENGGLFLFCGPSRQNNAELKQLHFSLLEEQVPTETEAALFMEEMAQQLAYAFFDQADIFTFENPLRFDSPEALYSYWSSYNLYDERLDDDFKMAAEKHFHSHSVFVTTKRLIGVQAFKW